MPVTRFHAGEFAAKARPTMTPAEHLEHFLQIEHMIARSMDDRAAQLDRAATEDLRLSAEAMRQGAAFHRERAAAVQAGIDALRAVTA